MPEIPCRGVRATRKFVIFFSLLPNRIAVATILSRQVFDPPAGFLSGSRFPVGMNYSPAGFAAQLVGLAVVRDDPDDFNRSASYWVAMQKRPARVRQAFNKLGTFAPKKDLDP
jgi:hypothetical protein